MFANLIAQAQSDGISRLNVAAVLVENGKILIAQRAASKKYLPNLWHIPGGQIDAGETIDGALKREVKEELDLEITDILADTKIIHDYIGHGDQKSRTLFILAKSSGQITLDYENQAYKYIDIAEINQYFEPNVQEINRRIFESALEILANF